MKLVYGAVSTFAVSAWAFPHLKSEVFEAELKRQGFQKRQVDGNQPGKIPCTPVQPPFDAQSQLVSTSGEHAFVAPGPDDARGPCPGLNAAANHGYLPHNGVASIPEFITGTYDVFGMASDLAGFLAVYGSIFDGNLDSWSIGGPTDNLPVLSGLLGTPTGISGSHNKYENDASPIRGDLYLYGNDYQSQVKNFQEFFNYQDGIPDDQVNFGLDNITAFRYQRFTESMNTNPYFFNGPFSGAIASPAAYTFIYRFMANHSEEYPEGRLDRKTLMSFYAMSGESGNFQYAEGQERIPDYWYKRHSTDSYTIPYFMCDMFNQVSVHPEFLSVGGNTGTTNSFTALDPGDVTGGVYNADTLLQGNNGYCYAFQLLAESAPDLLEGIFTDVTPAMNKLSGAISQATNGLNCPQISNLMYGQFGQFPGYTQSYDDYKGENVQGGGMGGIL